MRVWRSRKQGQCYTIRKYYFTETERTRKELVDLPLGLGVVAPKHQFPRNRFVRWRDSACIRKIKLFTRVVLVIDEDAFLEPQLHILPQGKEI